MLLLSFPPLLYPLVNSTGHTGINYLFILFFLGPPELPESAQRSSAADSGFKLSPPSRSSILISTRMFTDTFFAASGIRDPRGTWPGRYYFNDIYLYSYYYSVSLGAAVPGAAAAAYVSTRLSLASSFGNQSVPSLMRVKRDCGARRT